ncbi:MAG: MtnX-like HAD-IB family phosphatase [candidate division Zixibacteria bacterium]|nr:MtnX-like HAD-IB family phosphatase [candidate division Zixibacteria bacterium]
MKYHVFVDFDGTITINDVGHDFFEKFAFGKASDIVSKYRQGEISAVECLQKECDIYNENPASAYEVKQFVDSQKLTDGFIEFEEFCRSRQIRLTILSAGFDFYILPILKKYGLSHLEVYNNPTLIKDGQVIPDFIYYDKDTCWQCSNCKGQRIRELTLPDETSIFVGDGHSDSHGAEQANIVFAKSYLARYLDSSNINYFAYNDFFDVVKKFSDILRDG